MQTDLNKLVLTSLFDQFHSQPLKARAFPPVDIVKLDDNIYNIEVALAGFLEENIKVYIKQGVLYISGDKIKETQYQYLKKEISNKAFTRAFELDADMEITNVSFDNGMLHVTLQKNVKVSDEQHFKIGYSNTKKDSKLLNG